MNLFNLYSRVDQHCSLKQDETDCLRRLHDGSKRRLPEWYFQDELHPMTL
jgi:hypothetical protein